MPPTVKLTVIRGRDLAPKDRDLFGRHTSSDPYVEVYIGNRKFGTSQTIKKTLNPVWNETFTTQMTKKEASGPICLSVRVFDEDILSEPDSMGMFEIMIDPGEAVSFKEWMDIHPGSAKNAKGEVEVKLEVTL